MTHLILWIRFVLTSVLLALLAACGGGGSDTSNPVANISPSAEVIPGNQVSTVSSPTYMSNSEEIAAYQLLNAERSRCGFGLLGQNTKLDASAIAHAKWNLINNQISHIENGVAFPNGFTGSSPFDRANFQGYSGVFSVGEVISTRSAPTKNGMGENSIRGLLNAPFHLAHLMGSYSEVGLTVQSPQDVGLTSGTVQLVANLGHSVTVGRQEPASNEVLTYPCDGSTGVMYALTGESPNPVPGRDLSLNPLGVSVFVRVRNGQPLIISSAILKEEATGAEVETRPMVGGVNGSPDTILNLFNASRSYISANSAMKTETRYTMTLVGSNNGVSFNKTFSFSTGR
jgi:uncharacterized protein YkwD